MKNDCPYKDACPYLNFEPAARVLAQRNYLSRRVDEMERIVKNPPASWGALKTKTQNPIVLLGVDI